ncbi:MAG: hypothetical protein ACXWLF_00695 [Myxococcaceae bacterium]
MKKAILVSAVLLGSLVGSAARAQGIQQHIAALKKSMAASQQDLRTYQWVETTNVYVNGEQKSWKEQSCYYGADGSLQKIPVASSPPPPKKFGFRGAIQQSKIEDMTNEMQQAVALVKSYLPPQPFLIDQAVNTGNVSFDMLQPGQVVRLNFKNYKLPGDTFSITMNIQTNRLLGMSVRTYMGDPSKPVNMEAQMGTLMDGSTYTARTELQIPSSGLEIDSVNTGYRKNM